MNDTDEQGELAERVSASVARALALVGPAENGVERPREERATEPTVS